MFLSKLRHFLFRCSILKRIDTFFPTKGNWSWNQNFSLYKRKTHFRANTCIWIKDSFQRQLQKVINKHRALPDTSRWTKGPSLKENAWFGFFPSYSTEWDDSTEMQLQEWVTSLKYLLSTSADLKNWSLCSGGYQSIYFQGAI